LLVSRGSGTGLSLRKTLIDNSLDDIHCSYCLESGERERLEMRFKGKKASPGVSRLALITPQDPSV
jgi:hypothetical protein